MGLVSIPLRDFTLPWGGELIYRRDESREPILAVIDTIIEKAAARHADAREPKPVHRAWYLG
jgi:hypothetical protein